MEDYDHPHLHDAPDWRNNSQYAPTVHAHATMVVVVTCPVAILGVLAVLLALAIWVQDKAAFIPTTFLFKILAVAELVSIIFVVVDEWTHPFDEKTGPPGTVYIFRVWNLARAAFSQVCINLVLVLVVCRWLAVQHPLYLRMILTPIRVGLTAGFMALCSLAQVGCVQMLLIRDPRNTISIIAAFSVINDLLPCLGIFVCTMLTLITTVQAERENYDDNVYPQSKSTTKCVNVTGASMRKLTRVFTLTPANHPQVRLKEGSHTMLELTKAVMGLGVTYFLLYGVPRLVVVIILLHLDRTDDRLDTIITTESLEMIWVPISVLHVAVYFVFIDYFRNKVLVLTRKCRGWSPCCGGKKEAAGREDAVEATYVSNMNSITMISPERVDKVDVMDDSGISASEHYGRRDSTATNTETQHGKLHKAVPRATSGRRISARRSAGSRQMNVENERPVLQVATENDAEADHLSGHDRFEIRK